jgi:hypothetical protein
LAAAALGLTLLCCLVAWQAWSTRSAGAAGLPTFGKSSVGASVDVFASERKRVSRYALPEAGSVNKLTIYLSPTSTSGQQLLKGLIYSDAGGKPQALLGVSEQLTFKSSNAAGWYDMKFATPVKLAAGSYWIGVITGVTSYVAGFRYESVANARDYNNNAYASGPTNPFGSVTTNNELMSLYATYAPAGPPTNIKPPTITGTAQQGQTLTGHTGEWTNEPTSFAYQWLQCDGKAASCSTISGATGQSYVALAGDVGHTIKLQQTASNAGGTSSPATSSATAVLVPPVPVNTVEPTISGTAQKSQTLTEVHGEWTNSPTSFAYQWLRCDSSAGNCVPISGATSQTYVPASGDVGHTIKVRETTSNAGGPGSPATSSATAAVLPPSPPANTAQPTIAGEARQGRTLTETHGKWTSEPTGFTYQWLRCESSGSNCQPISGGTGQTYALVTGDVEHTIKVQETASNEGGPSGPATSDATAVVLGVPPAIVTPPTVSGTPQQGQTLTEAHGEWTNEPTSFAYQWLQCDGKAANCSPIAEATSQTYVASAGDAGHTIKVQETASNEAGPSSAGTSSATPAIVPLPPTNEGTPLITGAAQQGQTLSETHGGWANNPTSFTYQWLRCDSTGSNCLPISGATKQTYLQVAADVEHTIKVQEIAANAGGSSSPAASTATAVVIAGIVPPPTNEGPPSITGTAQQGQTLTELHGNWANEPTGFTYQWLQCDSLGNNCLPISGATKQSYEVAAADLQHTIEVQETASNEGGPSSPATSAPSAVVIASSVQHLEYVFVDGLISVYDMDQQQKLVKTINMPQTLGDTRGATVSPSTHMLFLSYGGDGGGTGTGSVLAYDLVNEKVVWEVHLPTGIDSGAVSPDGKRLYMPTGENDKSGIWNILDTSNGAIIGTIHAGAGAHNTIVSADGHYVYLGGRDYNYLEVYDTTTGKLRSIGPLAGGVRPFTVNGTNTLAFTTATRFLGFQVSSLTTGKVLFTMSFGSIPSGFPLSAPSHGASLSPDEKQLYVIDAVHKEVHVFDVSRVAEGVAPTELGVVPAPRLNVGTLSPCRYDCVRGGWVQHSLDGRFVYVPTSGEVIETATRTVVTTLSTLANTKKSLEIDWANGVPVATSGRTGVGHVG